MLASVIVIMGFRVRRQVCLVPICLGLAVFTLGLPFYKPQFPFLYNLKAGPLLYST